VYTAGIVFVLVGILLITNFRGLQVDPEKKLIRNYTAILGIKTGEWQSLPVIKKITYTSRNVSSWNTPNGISPTFKTNSTIYTIALFTDEENMVYFIQSENKKLADKRAKKLSSIFNSEIERL
jgi:hypothetical protein